jgi:hypothetical protein
VRLHFLEVRLGVFDIVKTVVADGCLGNHRC